MLKIILINLTIMTIMSAVLAFISNLPAILICACKTYFRFKFILAAFSCSVITCPAYSGRSRCESGRAHCGVHVSQHRQPSPGRHARHDGSQAAPVLFQQQSSLHTPAHAHRDSAARDATSQKIVYSYRGQRYHLVRARFRLSTFSHWLLSPFTLF